MDAEHGPDSAEAWLRTCDECGKELLQRTRGQPRLNCGDPACVRSRAKRYRRQAAGALSLERVISTPYEGAPDKVRPVVVAAAPTPSRRQSAATERQPAFEERHMAASREVTRMVTNLWAAEQLNAKNRSKFDYRAAFEQLRDSALPLVQIVNEADGTTLRPRH